MSHLQEGTKLKGGKYTIHQVLGQGGFGITYLATTVQQVEVDGPMGRIKTEAEVKVTVKEFFMKSLCDRDEATNHVSVPSSGSRDLVAKYRKKFIKEAENISKLNHQNIIKVMDIFEANGTAYYVMEYIDGGSLNELVSAKGKLPETDALRYIRMIASALGYLHSNHMTHLDVKPGNVLRRSADDSAVLIDFGLSKNYDEAGDATSSTPVGVSVGYAPLEQARVGGVGKFAPTADIYSLGATLYKLLTGDTPPPANDIVTDGFPPRPDYVSATLWSAIDKAMQPRPADRPQSINDFLALLDESAEETLPMGNTPHKAPEQMHVDVEKKATAKITPHVESDNADTLLMDDTKKPKAPEPKKSSANKGVLWGIISGCAVAIIAVVAVMMNNGMETIVEPEQPIASYSNGILTVNDVQYNMIKVDGGTFTMGATSEQGSDAYDWEKPPHQVTLSTYSIGETEVTQALWKAVMGKNPSNFKGDNKPVEQVSWDDCQKFIKKLNELTGETFRLPTEAEWEYACRGGNKSNGYKYSGSNKLGDVAWYESNSSNKTHDVATKQPNELGIYDMSGNLYEWCQDWYGDYKSSAQTDPTGPSSGSYRVSRGGSWINYARNCRSSYRNDYSPDCSISGLGLRLAR